MLRDGLSTSAQESLNEMRIAVADFVGASLGVDRAADGEPQGD